MFFYTVYQHKKHKNKQQEHLKITHSRWAERHHLDIVKTSLMYINEHKSNINLFAGRQPKWIDSDMRWSL